MILQKRKKKRNTCISSVSIFSTQCSCLQTSSIVCYSWWQCIQTAQRSLPCVVSWCWLCCRRMVWVASSSAESRLQQRGWSSLGGLMASSFSSSDAELLRTGFFSRARSRKERMAWLQSSAMSSRGGACLCICWETDKAKLLLEYCNMKGKNQKLQRQWRNWKVLQQLWPSFLFEWHCEY